MEPGQPWVRSRGRASGWADRAWRKWIAGSSMVVRKCAKSFSRASRDSPVVDVPPVLDQLAQVVDGDAVLPAGVFDLVGEAGLGQARSEVVEDRIVDPDRNGSIASVTDRPHRLRRPWNCPPLPLLRRVTLLRRRTGSSGSVRSTEISRSVNRHRALGLLEGVGVLTGQVDGDGLAPGRSRSTVQQQWDEAVVASAATSMLRLVMRCLVRWSPSRAIRFS